MCKSHDWTGQVAFKGNVGLYMRRISLAVGYERHQVSIRKPVKIQTPELYPRVLPRMFIPPQKGSKFCQEGSQKICLRFYDRAA
jgi:hypothetical protein